MFTQTNIPLDEMKKIIKQAVYEGTLLALREHDLEKREKELEKRQQKLDEKWNEVSKKDSGFSID